MKHKNIVVVLGLGALLAVPLTTAVAQQTSQSLGDAARKVKEQQKQAPKAKVVWTNDNLPTSATVSVVGQSSPPSSTASSNEAQPAAPSDAATGAGDLSKASAELTEAQKELESLKTDLDIAQREYKLDSDQHYSVPDYATDQQGLAKLEADKTRITTKQQAVDAAQKKVEEIQKQVDELSDKSKSEGAAPKS